MPQTTSLAEAFPILTRGPKTEMNHSALLAALAIPATIGASDKSAESSVGTSGDHLPTSAGPRHLCVVGSR
jgi:hypothetical protein